jgi:uncharacterized protein (DUF2461 family)
LSCFAHYVNEYRRVNPTGKIYISFTITEVLEKCAIRERPNNFFATIDPNRKAYHELSTEEQKLYKPYEVNADFLDIIDRKSTIPVETVFPGEIKRPFFNRIL